MAQAPTPPPAQRPPPMLTPDERAELHRRHQAQQQAQHAASPNAHQPDPKAPEPPKEAESPTLTPGERDGTDRPEKHFHSGVQQALDRGRDPPIPDDLVNTGGVPGGSPSRPMDPPPEGAVVGNMGAAAPEPVKTGPGNEQPSRQEPGPGV